ncbi:hypothetical protein [Bacteroides sp.]|jgi:hypothetical protein|uniref:hypothetical protein n=1 Tax=Bacteroides sp. TaxID=29523 RepID=UPI0025878119|nr:hypothetical protein [Bacteroides sp.]
MYGFKEKTKYFNELRNVAAAAADLNLLQVSAPAHPKLKMFARNPQRYADDILYTLLDLKSKEAIRINRREIEKAKEEAGAENILDTGGTCAGAEILSDGNTATCLENEPGTKGTSVQEEKNPFEIDAEIYEKQAEAELREQERQEAEKRASQAEEQAEVLEQENQELKEELETEQEARVEAEERAEQAEQSLEEEKKKEPTKVAPKSKSTKSTRKSTGKTSKTKTSK